MLADANVVSQMNEIVEARAPTDTRLPRRPAIDRAVRADLHIVLADNRAELRNLAMRGTVPRETETVGTDHRAAVNHHVVAELATLPHSHSGVQDAAFAHLRLCADERQRADHRACADRRTAFDHRLRTDRDAFTQLDALTDDRTDVDTGGLAPAGRSGTGSPPRGTRRTDQRSGMMDCDSPLVPFATRIAVASVAAAYGA